MQWKSSISVHSDVGGVVGIGFGVVLLPPGPRVGGVVGIDVGGVDAKGVVMLECPGVEVVDVKGVVDCVVVLLSPPPPRNLNHRLGHRQWCLDHMSYCRCQMILRFHM